MAQPIGPAITEATRTWRPRLGRRGQVDAGECASDARPGMRVALAQIAPVVGDLAGNRARIEEAAAKAAAAGARLVVLPELALTGYPPLDLLGRDGFVRAQLRELDALAASSRDIAIAVGAVLPAQAPGSKSIHNAAVLLDGGRIVATRAKSLLPTYDVFDENRYFQPAATREPVRLDDPRLPVLGLTICEDLWADEVPYGVDPGRELSGAGAELLLNVSASPLHARRPLFRREPFAAQAARHRRPNVFVNGGATTI